MRVFVVCAALALGPGCGKAAASPPPPAPPQAEPAARRGYILGVEGLLHCLQASDGKKLWSKDTAKDFGVQQNFFGVGGAPVVEGDLLIANIGGSPPGSPGIQTGQVKGNGSGIVAFD